MSFKTITFLPFKPIWILQSATNTHSHRSWEHRVEQEEGWNSVKGWYAVYVQAKKKAKKETQAGKNWEAWKVSVAPSKKI